ncbi:ABC transporter substrate-binding protein [Acidiphilium acidophilum]|uniref:ABC transporter substrate-binding protein n=1 Tax=Acidiphilium acidophilum TaxID=76588 RepID=UPI002E8E61AE|nr:ABC transporter substrate-binding protein [Acidiphilium acidophilum]
MTAPPPPHSPYGSRLDRRSLIGAGFAGLATVVVSPESAIAAGGAKAPPPPSQPTLCGLFPSSGPEALAGDEAWRGVTLALDTANRSRPNPIRLIRADAADPTKSIAALAASTPPTACLGTMSSSRSFAATAAAELANIPYVELDAPADAITTRGFKMLHRTGLTTTDLAIRTIAAITDLLAPAWHRAPGTLRVALLFDDGATDGAFAASMLAQAKQAKLPVLLVMGYGSDKLDLSNQVERMQRAQIDLLIHAGQPEHVILLYEALAIAAWRPRMIIGAGSGYGMSAIGDALGHRIEHTMVVDAPLYDKPAQAILRAYRDRYATPPHSSISLTTYVGTMLVITALDQGRSLGAALTALKRKRGALANGWGVDFDADGQNRASFATLQQWRSGALVTIDPSIEGAKAPRTSL